MDFLTSNIRPLYFKYLSAAFGSALITSVYSIVDVAMVGQYQGPDGTAALAIVSPIWNIIYSLGLLMGIGGSVIFSLLKGREDSSYDDMNQYFTVAVIGSVILAVLTWIGVGLFDAELFLFFGASDHLLPLAQEYLLPVKFVLPLFLFNQMLAAFLRNDNNPTLATVSVLAGGIFNVFGDYIFIFTFDMGIFGAGLATAIGSTISFLLMLTHFFTKKNSLAIVKPINLLSKLKEITITGFPTFFIDVAMGILTILFNRQIMKYLGINALSVYGVIVNLSTFVQSCAYSVGQAAQPLISVNFGARLGNRVKETLKYALRTVVFFSLFWTMIGLAIPNTFIRIFMSPTPEILEIAPSIIRMYSLSFLFLPLNIFSTYYFQTLMKAKAAFFVSVSRGFVISGFFILLFPLVNESFIWVAMPVTELVVAGYVVTRMIRYTKQLPTEGKLLES